MISQHAPLRFAPLNIKNCPDRFTQLFSFSDASMSTATEDQAREACMVVLGVANKRDGVVMCAGSVMYWHSRKLTRICRSTAQSEWLALSNTTEVTLAFQIILTEILSGEFQISFLHCSESVPISSPFKKPPSNESVLTELREIGRLTVPISPSLYVTQKCIFAWCKSCGESASLSWKDIAEIYLSVCGATSRSTTRPSMRALILCDCSNVISSVSQGNPKCKDKTAKLMRNHIRDMRSFMTITFNCAHLNLRDIGAKIQGNVTIYRHFSVTGVFSIGFLPRAERKILLQSRKKIGNSRPVKIYK